MNLTPPICNYLAPDSNTAFIADTGCSGHYDAYNRDPKNALVVTPVNVLLPNGSHMSSTHTKHLNIPSLPPAACLQHQFPAMKTTGLLSIGQLCDHGCSATFSQHHLVIKKKSNNNFGRSPQLFKRHVDGPARWTGTTTPHGPSHLQCNHA